MARPTVMIVEDEPEIAELIKFHLEREGLSAGVIGSGQVALDAVRRKPPDLLVLDLMLPDVDGLEVCRRLKWSDETRHVPIVIVSAKGEESDIVAGIELGADDYVTKPFSPKILLARVKNVLRRYAASPDPDLRPGGRIRVGEIAIDIDRHAVTVGGAPITLTVTEFGILRYLAARPGFVRTRDQIISAVHGSGAVLSSRTVDVHVTALRKKLGAAGSLIETVRGVGYRLAEHAAETVV